MNELTQLQKLALVDLVQFAEDHARDVFGEKEEIEYGTVNGNAILESARIISNFIEDEGAFDNDICPSAPRPLMEGETAHKWYRTTNFEKVEIDECSECGAVKELCNQCDLGITEYPTTAENTCSWCERDLTSGSPNVS